MRRSTAFAAGVAAALLTITSCATGGSSGNKKDGPTLSASQTALSGEVTVWSWDTAAKALKRLAPEFERRHPGVKVKVVDIGYDSANDKITVGLKSGKGMPDITTVEGPRLQSFIASFPGGLYDLTAQATKYKKDFDPAAWRTVTDDKGKVFALPWDTGPVALYYRKDYFAKAGVDPNSLHTWDDYVRAGEQIKAKTGKKMLILDNREDNTFLTLLQQQGQGYFKDGRIALTSPQAVRAMALLKTLNDKGLIGYYRGWDGQVSETKAGKVATFPTAAWWAGTMIDEMQDAKGKWGVVPLPAFDQGGVRTSNQGGSRLAVSSQTKNPQAAWAFTEFALANKDNQVSMMKNEALFPAYLPALSDPFFNAPQPYFGGDPVYKVFADLVAKIPPIEYGKNGAKASELVWSANAGVLLRGKDPKATLDSTAEQLAAATGLQIAQ